jgi:hypothetical protein
MTVGGRHPLAATTAAQGRICQPRILWEAVFNNRPDNARVLAGAGADPWQTMMNGWSPGRLSLATPTPDLFALPDGEAGLTAAEITAYLCHYQAVAYCFAGAGVLPTDARSILQVAEAARARWWS